MNSNPEISIVIPVFNSAKLIQEAIQSILEQTYQDFEIIVVDDGSKDNPLEIINKFGDNRLKYYYQENQGPAAARNSGIKKTSGRWIAFLDADDLFPPGKLFIQKEALRNDPGLMLVAGRIQYISESNLNREYLFENLSEQTMINVHLGSILCRKELFQDKFIGMFNEDLTYSEDVDWWFRILEKKIKFKILPDITLIYRKHENNMTHDESKNSAYFLKAIKKSLDRRRTGNNKAVDLPGLRDFSESSSKLYRNNPLVSIIIFDIVKAQNPATLIENIYRQNYRPIEIIVADANHDLELKYMIQSFPGIKYQPVLHPGILNLFREVINISEGEFIAFISMRDTWNQNKLRIQVNYMINNPDKTYSFTFTEFAKPKKENMTGNKPGDGIEMIKNKFYIGSLLAKKSDIKIPDPPGPLISTGADGLINSIVVSKACSMIPRKLVVTESQEYKDFN